MATTTTTETKNAYNKFFVPEEDLKYVPPYFRDTIETPTEVKCQTTGTWPAWLEGTFVRQVVERWLSVFFAVLTS